jgi:LuxR family maltose regulon positive regulatory protein
MDSASHWARTYLKQEDEEPSLIARALQDICLVRVLLTTARYEDALERLDQTLQRARAARREAHVIELLALQALVHQETNEEQAAHASLTEALSLAQAEGYIRLFVDEGLPMANLLLSLKQRKPAQETYIDTLLAVFAAEKIILFDAP